MLAISYNILKTLNAYNSKCHKWTYALLALGSSFVAQVNDAALTYEQNQMALKYADDLTIVDNTFRNETSTIQNNLKDFDEWANMNKLNLNPKKCMYMAVSFT